MLKFPYMKNNATFLLVAVLLSGCNLFQQVEKNKSSSASNSSEQTESFSTEIDSGKVQATRKWTIVPPVINQSNLPKYTPPVVPGDDQGNPDFKSAFLDMQQKYYDLYNLSKSGWMTMEESIQEQKGKSTTLAIATDTKKNEKESESQVTKKPDPTFLFILAGVFLIVFAVLIIYIVSLSRKVTKLLNKP